MRKRRVWVLWARTWNNGDVRIHRVTSKKVYQKYMAKMNGYMEVYDIRGGLSEGLPAYRCESTDKVMLETMRDLAHPVPKGN
jgi:hypothetical protein